MSTNGIRWQRYQFVIKYAMTGVQYCITYCWKGECDIIPCGLFCKSLSDLDVACTAGVSERFFDEVILE